MTPITAHDLPPPLPLYTHEHAIGNRSGEHTADIDGEEAAPTDEEGSKLHLAGSLRL